MSQAEPLDPGGHVVTNLTGPSDRGVIDSVDNSQQIGEGDIVIIPAGVAHGFSEITEPITYMVVRIDPDGAPTPEGSGFFADEAPAGEASLGAASSAGESSPATTLTVAYVSMIATDSGVVTNSTPSAARRSIWGVLAWEWR